MIIRRLEKGDLETRVEWMNNPLIYSSMHFEVPILMERTIQWYESNLTNDKRFDVTVLEDGEIVAFGGFTSINREIGKAETYLFASPFQLHKGIGTRAKKLICEFGFKELGLNKIYFITNEDNYASIRVNEKCGFKLEGRLRKEYLTKDGEFKDRLYFGLLKEEWISNQ
jgi:RimJ/RimL family protein N-acetyltransferase